MSSGLEIGTELAGYRVLGLLGRGGMGFVFEAEHLLLGRKAALKTLAPELAQDKDFRERFIRESQMIAALDHPNIIPIYDAGEEDGIVYIVMRYVDGEDLKQRIDRDGALKSDKALGVLEHAAAALDSAHSRELVHRDVKPANILLEEATGRTYLTDFGIAKSYRSKGLTEPGFFLGTIDYAAPEQIEGKEIGPALDVYALGCVFFECLTGKRPFDRDTDLAVIHAHLLDSPPAPSELVPELPPELDAVVARALAKAESDRYPSCRELVDDARAALAGSETTAARGTTARPRMTQTAKVLQTRLPIPASSIVGREREIESASELVRRPDVRLVTLTGIGGTGKTRLALEVARGLAAELGGAVFVDLAPISDPSLVATAIGSALDVEESPGRTLLDAIHARLRDEPVLLVLDNFEQVLSAAPFVAELLEVAPGLKVLATSQAALRIRAEHEFVVPPLELPDAAESRGASALAGSAAAVLFVERARAVKPDFELTDENASDVAEICRRLDGLPLAIELAAARAKLLSPQAILGRLEQRLELLTGGARDLPTRQQTLRSAIDWSYNLLDETEQALFSRLGVFVGGCSLEGVAAVCGAPDELGLGEVMDGVASLVDKSLVRQRDGIDGEPRFSMFETIREYARDRLSARGELEDQRRLHANRYVGLAEAAEPELTGPNQAAWLERLDEENDNIRAAIAWSLESGEYELALRMAGALVRFWSTRGHMTEGRRSLASALAPGGSVPPLVRAKALFAAGYAALGQGDYMEAKPYFEESLAIARDLGETRLEAASLAQIAWLLMTRGAYVSEADERAEVVAEKSLAQARELGDKLTASGALNTLAELTAQTGDEGKAGELFEESLTLRRELGDKRLVSNSLLNLGRHELTRGRLDRAQSLLQEGLRLADQVRDTWSVSVALSNLGRVSLYEGDFAKAESRFRDGLKLAQNRGDKRVLSECLQGLAAAAGGRGEGAAAARLFGTAAALLQGIGASPSAAERAVEERFATVVKEELGEEAFARELAAGRGQDPEEVILAVLEEPPPPSRAEETLRSSGRA